MVKTFSIHSRLRAVIGAGSESVNCFCQQLTVSYSTNLQASRQATNQTANPAGSKQFPINNRFTTCKSPQLLQFGLLFCLLFWVRWRIGVGIRYEIREGVKGYAGRGGGVVYLWLHVNDIMKMKLV